MATAGALFTNFPLREVIAPSAHKVMVRSCYSGEKKQHFPLLLLSGTRLYTPRDYTHPVQLQEIKQGTGNQGTDMSEGYSAQRKSEFGRDSNTYFSCISQVCCSQQGHSTWGNLLVLVL